nr:universal stress protein [Amycolatopsis sp. YIM 10]
MTDAHKAMRGYLASEFYAATHAETGRPAPAAPEPMDTGKPVVVGIDGSRGALDAAVWAARAADRRGVVLRLVHACQLPGLDELSRRRMKSRAAPGWRRPKRRCRA